MDQLDPEHLLPYLQIRYSSLYFFIRISLFIFFNCRLRLMAYECFVLDTTISQAVVVLHNIALLEFFEISTRIIA